jgi:hypothetical protein
MSLPPDLESVIEAAWRKGREIPGYVGYHEFRALAMLHAGARGEGVNVEIGSFQDKSTIGLARLSAHYGLGPVVGIDPHDAPCVADPVLGTLSSSFESFQSALRSAMSRFTKPGQPKWRRVGIGPFVFCGSTATTPGPA